MAELPDKRFIIQYKDYHRFESIPIPWGGPEGDFEEALLSRGSERITSDATLDLATLGRILRFSAGRRSEETENRTYPSAGARYPIELYLLSFEVDGLEPAAYHYNPLDNALVRLWDAPEREEVAVLWGEGPPDLSQSRAIVLMSSVTGRTTMKYGPGGELFPPIECGYLGQNILLMAQKCGLNSVPLGIQWTSDEFSALFDLDEDFESIIHAIALY
jgi:SagB-type dehydrogenase family enzyme